MCVGTLKFSIITPVYNRVDCIERCLESVKKQDYINWEHIVVDDGSTDGTNLLLENLSKNDERLKYVRQSQNGGTNSARNQALNFVSGDFVIFLDSDDVLTGEALNVMAKAIHEYADYKYYLFAVSDRLEYYNTQSLLKEQQPAVVTYSNWLTGEVTGDFVHVISSDIWKGVRFHEKYRIYEELTFLELYKQTGKQLFVNTVIIQRERNRADSVTNESSLYKKNAIRFSKEVMGLILKSHTQGYIACGRVDTLIHHINKLYLYTLMLGNYRELPELEEKLESYGGNLPVFYKYLKFFRLGVIFSWGVKGYSFCKHKVRD